EKLVAITASNIQNSRVRLHLTQGFLNMAASSARRLAGGPWVDGFPAGSAIGARKYAGRCRAARYSSRSIKDSSQRLIYRRARRRFVSHIRFLPCICSLFHSAQLKDGRRLVKSRSFANLGA